MNTQRSRLGPISGGDASRIGRNSGRERAGWLEDASYFAAAIRAVDRAYPSEGA